MEKVFTLLLTLYLWQMPLLNLANETLGNVVTCIQLFAEGHIIEIIDVLCQN